jgi:hypothetical protein
MGPRPSLFDAGRAGVACAVLAAAGTARGQTEITYEQGGARMEFQAWNGTAWASEVWVQPGSRVEWRMRMSYVGTRTDLFAGGDVLYQPTISNVDYTDNGDGVDGLGVWRNGGNSSNNVFGSMLTAAEGESGLPLPGYGRVRFGGTAAAATGSNTMTMFRHSGGSDGAPSGGWMRLAGSFVTQWPRELNFPAPPLDVTATDMNNILRGISAHQAPSAFGDPSFVSGTQNLVIFRQALILSNSGDSRMLTISTFREAFRRVGGTTGTAEGDDRRVIQWITGVADTAASHRATDPTIIPATIWVNVPAPFALPALLVCSTSRRRR